MPLPWKFHTILTISDTTMIGNIFMSSHAFYIGLRMDILDEKSWSPVRFEPLTSGMASRRANHLPTELSMIYHITWRKNEGESQIYTTLAWVWPLMTMKSGNCFTCQPSMELCHLQLSVEHAFSASSKRCGGRDFQFSRVVLTTFCVLVWLVDDRNY